MKRLMLATCIVAFATVSAVGVRAADDPAVTIFKKNGCNECHSISAVGVQKEKKKAEGTTEPAATAPAGTAPAAGTPAATAPAGTAPAATAATDTKKKKTPPDLSGVGLEHDAKWISAFINKEELLDGEKHEKRFKGPEEDRRTLAMFLASMKTKAAKTEAAPESKK